MTLRIRITHLEKDSKSALRVFDYFNELDHTIRPGGFAEFWVHATTFIQLEEIPNEKEGEAK